MWRGLFVRHIDYPPNKPPRSGHQPHIAIVRPKDMPAHVLDSVVGHRFVAVRISYRTFGFVPSTSSPGSRESSPWGTTGNIARVDGLQQPRLKPDHRRHRLAQACHTTIVQQHPLDAPIVESRQSSVRVADVPILDLEFFKAVISHPLRFPSTLPYLGTIQCSIVWLGISRDFEVRYGHHKEAKSAFLARVGLPTTLIPSQSR